MSCNSFTQNIFIQNLIPRMKNQFIESQSKCGYLISSRFNELWLVPTRDVTIHRFSRIADSQFIWQFPNRIAIQWIDSFLVTHICFLVFLIAFHHHIWFRIVKFESKWLEVSIGKWIDSSLKVNCQFSIHLEIGFLNWFSIQWIVTSLGDKRNAFLPVLIK